MSDSYEQQLRASLFSGGNAAYLEELYELFLEDPQSIAPEWREFFAGFRAAGAAGGDVPHGPIIAEFERRAREPRRAVAAGGMDPVMIEKQAAVMRLIEAYRTRGHRHARLDPLGLAPLPKEPDLELAHYGLSDADLDTEFSTVSLTGPDRMKLRDILAMLRSTYAGTIGFEFQHISVSEERGWLKDRIETSRGRIALSAEERKHLLEQLTAAEGLEKYLHTRFVGQKRFSLEGGESFIPLLSDVIQQGGAAGVQEMVIGMAHRGRLNVLINVLGKSPRELFSEFEGVYDPKVTDRSGDVKYHLGFSSDISTPGGNVHLALAFNPSHLEIVNPVVEGSVRARQDRRGDVRGDKVMPILVHGDAAFAGQGVVMETLQLSQARGFYTGGTVHIVINNQVGFTISNPADARSTPYATDVAKMLEAPILHVNGDDAEAVIFAARLAVEYRMKFHKDIVIDLVCYRRHGHNEADEPSATQPVMYKIIKQHKTTRELYAEKLQQEGVIAETDARRMVENYRAGLDEGRTVAPAVLGMIGNEYTADWSRFQQHAMDVEVDTSIDEARLRRLGEAITTVPENFRLHGRVQKIVDDRRKMLAGEQPMDWGFAETMAYAALMSDRFSVRLTGQDAGRGTFFHRHAVWHNQEDASTYIPLQSLADGRVRFTVVDSLLSEEAVVGFEYGYSTADPDALVIWEAQFGDFANGAQVVVDQFISSGEAKWGRYCGLVMFLPHGYEGQGPEHSSARLERYLQLCAQHNMQVCVPSTPAQMFHMLRRQMMRPLRKPLIVMTPKSLLRHKLSVSPLEDLTGGRFHHIIPEIDALDAKKVSTVVFCSGKVYYDLLEARRADERNDVAIIRIEQLYPFPEKEYEAQLRKYPNARDIVWCQEEPMNQGAWYQIRHRLQQGLGKDHTLRYAGREHAASTAAGYFQMHVAEQKALIEDALNGGNTNHGNQRKTGTEKA
ncbi:MAG TPA: 2-oxoglutarate dehydrogenase E1 component [Gammaproteobacteria bacterium]|nr:2-oxoglutarate dehydrogenase E1 component [Gammaproteobacteria bacterium]